MNTNPEPTPMFEVFSALFDYFCESETVSHESILAHLISAGRDPWEIGCAATCLDALFSTTDTAAKTQTSPSAIRIFSADEQLRLPLEVQDFLHSVMKTGEIQFAERERLIHALLNLPDDEITIANAKLLMLIRLNNAVQDLSDEMGEKLLNVFDDKTIVH
ncbi:MAG: DUF494 family protein [Neisseriaceae bacterium]|nr:DUF494 family protein [Neisseriaceae bacterium]